MKNNIVDSLNIPFANKEIIKTLLEKGGNFEEIKKSNVYIIRLNKKNYYFLNEYTPVIPYVYGIIFQDQNYIYKILKAKNINISYDKNKISKLNYCRLFITKNGYYNIIQKQLPFIFGDGYSTFEELVSGENLRRLNSYDPYLLPIKINNKFNKKLTKIPKKGETIVFKSIKNLNEGASLIDMTKIFHKSFIDLAKKILQLFPGLGYLNIGICADDYNKSSLKQNYIICLLSLSLEENFYHAMTNGKTYKMPKDVISELIIHEKV